MSLQPANARFRRAVRGFYAWLGSLVFAGLAPIVAVNLIDTGTLMGRVGGVVAGTVGWLPMAAVIIGIIRAGDEFQRRLHLVALAISFGISLVVLTGLDVASRADFMSPPPLSILWLTFVSIWLVMLILVKLWFERVS